VVRFAARAQQPATLNDVIEATTSGFGTFETCRPALAMSVHRGRSEVTGERSERRDWHLSDLVVWANVGFAPEVVGREYFLSRARLLSWYK
jgi:hypothetical protein